jgi:hypothetical protein
VEWRRFPPLVALPQISLGFCRWGTVAAMNLMTCAPDPTSSLYCAVRRGTTNLKRLDTPDQGVGSRPSSAGLEEINSNINCSMSGGRISSTI